MSIITLATSKGGAGKTTVAQIILGSLVEQRYKVAALDADFNHTLSDWITQVRKDSEFPITVRHEIDETKIIPTVSSLIDNHSVVVIDTAGTATQATVFAIGCADLVLVPIKSSLQDVVEALKTVNLVKSASQMTKRSINVRVIFTDYQLRTNVAAHTESQIRKYDLPMMSTKIEHLVGFKEMSYVGRVPNAGLPGLTVSYLLDELREIGVIPSTPRQEKKIRIASRRAG